MLTTPQTFGTSRGNFDLNSSSLVRARNGRKLTCLLPRSNVKLQLHGQTSTSLNHGQTPTSPHHGRNSTLWQRTPFSAPMAEAQLCACIVQSQIPTDSFSKSLSNSQNQRFRAWRHSHSSSISYLGLLWLLWLSYPLRTSVNCTQCYAPELRAE